MSTQTFSRRCTLQMPTGAAAPSAIRPTTARAAAPVRMISHRYPALELYAKKMQEAVPGTTVVEL